MAKELRIPYGLYLDFTPADYSAGKKYLTLNTDGLVTKASTIPVDDISGGADLTEATSSVLTISATGVLLGAATIQVKQAGAAQSGYLSTADWNTFNNKVSASLTDSYLFVGDVSNEPVGVAVSGVIALANDGTTSFTSGAIVNADVNANAAIEMNKLNPLTAARAVVTGGGGFFEVSAVTATQVGYLGNLSQDLQASLDSIAITIVGLTTSGTVQGPSASVDGYAIVWYAGITQWALGPVGAEGSITGAGSSTDNALVRWNGVDGTSIQSSSVIIDDSDNITGVASITVGTAGIHLLDSDASHDLIFATDDLTGDRTFTITTGDADRNLTLSGDPTLDDWFDQSVKTTDSPVFAGATLSNAGGLHLLDSDESHDLIIRTTSDLSADRELIFVTGDATRTLTINASGTLYVTGGTDVAVADGGTGLSAIAALSILVANTANTYVALTPAAGQSIRMNAGGTAWEAYTPGGGGGGGWAVTGTTTLTGAVTVDTFAANLTQIVLSSTADSTLWLTDKSLSGSPSGEANYLGIFDGSGSRGAAIQSYNFTTGDSVRLAFGLTTYGGAQFIDTRATPTGLEYGGDYSAGFSARSLVDKGYVDSVSGITVGTTTITSGTNTRILYNNSGVVSEYTISGTGNVAMTTSPTFVTPILGTPTSGNLANCTFPTLNQNTTGSAATLTTTRTLWGQNFNGSANVTGTLALGSASITMTGSIAATGSRVTKGWFTNLEITNAPTVNGTSATGTGGLVLATSPTLVTPALGTPSALVGTNITGTGTGFTSGITNALKSATTTVNVSSATAPTVGQVLTATGGSAATWQNPSSGFADPMTTRGDIIIRNAANATARLGVGANTYVLTSDGTDVAWAAPSGGIGGSTGSVDNALLRADGTGGSTMQSSSASIADTGFLTLGTGSTELSQIIFSTGTNTDVGLSLFPKGAGKVYASGGLRLQGTDTSIVGIIGGQQVSLQSSSDSTSDSGDILIKTGAAGGTGDNDSGNIYVDLGAKNASGVVGNIGLFSSSVADWQDMEKGLFVGNATTSPTDNPVNGIWAWALDVASSSELFVRNEAGIVTQLTGRLEEIQVACSDETTALTTGAAKITFRMPYGMTLTAVRASVTTAPTGATLIVDINEGGVSIFSTRLTIDASEKTSTTAATPAVISDATLADDAEITIDIDQIGSSVAGTGLKVTLIGYKTI